MLTSRWTTASMALSLTLGLVLARPAEANPKADFFSRTTEAPAKSAKAPPASPAGKKDIAAPVKWFESIDDAVAAHKPSAADRVILSRPFNQEAERVQEWINTAARVAKNYRELSALLKKTAVPNNLPGLKEYRDLTAEWYDDAASVYEDLIRPRKAARTIEELDEQINQIKERAQRISQTNTNLKAMDMSLRKTFKVHLARHEDALQQYVRQR